MKTKTVIVRSAVATVAAAAVGLGAFSASAEARRFRPCICPDVYAPVTCSNGQTYSNSCVAGCYGATGCVPGDWAWK